jgi:hypothetical protein
VAAVVAVLAHEACPTSGEIYATGGGQVSRIYLAETPGYLNPDLTPEDILANWEAVMAPQRSTEIGNLAAYTDHFYSRLPGWPDR